MRPVQIDSVGPGHFRSDEPKVAPSVKKLLARFILWTSGWRYAGGQPEAPKYVLIAAPHTSNFDLIFMLSIALLCELKIHWFGKHTLFRFPLGWFLRRLGGIPVDRRSPQNLVEVIAEEFRSRDTLVLAVPPEGTRSYRDYWKSGFYHIARAADVPICMGYLDYSKREGGFGATFTPSGDMSADMDHIRSFYADKVGRRPKNQNRIKLRGEDEESPT